LGGTQDPIEGGLGECLRRGSWFEGNKREVVEKSKKGEKNGGGEEKWPKCIPASKKPIGRNLAHIA